MLKPIGFYEVKNPFAISTFYFIIELFYAFLFLMKYNIERIINTPNIISDNCNISILFILYILYNNIKIYIINN